ncbi:hypothetical protein AUEXF2481DRAFT_677822 [Aureobasidium subglaciale EXF-2481]|uniref:Uncharacterized protein n=1 Tax=Aureobasidium subglaciale (strain EXF-2481) TaxID=1043005 RepID=A0A074YHS5_AURSE|nr:uncharacterized protein AUEXF2481DRAFT_677822 [Aureobasidium subglaciale EXF-2481]KEQ95604.1 hypothetical protein AUEXF2481DRAFT_677822 [Aureobasidium subglaciale EXF-2481]
MSPEEKADGVSHDLSTTLDRTSIAVTGPGRSSKEVQVFQTPDQSEDTGTVVRAKLSGSGRWYPPDIYWSYDQKQSITSQVLENLSLIKNHNVAQESKQRATALSSDAAKWLSAPDDDSAVDWDSYASMYVCMERYARRSLHHRRLYRTSFP